MFERLLFLVLNWLLLSACIATTGQNFVNQWPNIYVLVLLWGMLMVVVVLRIKHKDVTNFQVIAAFVWTGFSMPGYFPRRERFWFENEYTFPVLFVIMLILFGIDVWRTLKKKTTGSS